MTKLHAILAVEKTVKADAQREGSDLHKVLGKTGADGPFAGLNRTYAPKDIDGDQLAGASQKVQLTVAGDILPRLGKILTSWFDVELAKDTANQTAVADVVVDGHPLLTDVPVTYLLFLAKQLTELAAFVSHLPTLDPGQEWTEDQNTGHWVTPPQETTAKKPITRPLVLAPETEHHPAQVQLVTEQVVIGTYTARLYSGGIRGKDRQALADRVTALSNAVRVARAAANDTDVPAVTAGAKIFGYLFP